MDSKLNFDYFKIYIITKIILESTIIPNTRLEIGSREVFLSGKGMITNNPGIETANFRFYIKQLLNNIPSIEKKNHHITFDCEDYSDYDEERNPNTILYGKIKKIDKAMKRIYISRDDGNENDRNENFTYPEALLSLYNEKKIIFVNNIICYFIEYKHGTRTFQIDSGDNEAGDESDNDEPKYNYLKTINKKYTEIILEYGSNPDFDKYLKLNIDLKLKVITRYGFFTDNNFHYSFYFKNDSFFHIPIHIYLDGINVKLSPSINELGDIHFLELFKLQYNNFIDNNPNLDNERQYIDHRSEEALKFIRKILNKNSLIYFKLNILKKIVPSTQITVKIFREININTKKYLTLINMFIQKLRLNELSSLGEKKYIGDFWKDCSNEKVKSCYFIEYNNDYTITNGIYNKMIYNNTEILEEFNTIENKLDSDIKLIKNNINLDQPQKFHEKIRRFINSNKSSLEDSDIIDQLKSQLLRYRYTNNNLIDCFIQPNNTNRLRQNVCNDIIGKNYKCFLNSLTTGECHNFIKNPELDEVNLNRDIYKYFLLVKKELEYSNKIINFNILKYKINLPDIIIISNKNKTKINLYKNTNDILLKNIKIIIETCKHGLTEIIYNNLVYSLAYLEKYYKSQLKLYEESKFNYLNIFNYFNTNKFGIQLNMIFYLFIYNMNQEVLKKYLPYKVIIGIHNRLNIIRKIKALDRNKYKDDDINNFINILLLQDSKLTYYLKNINSIFNNKTIEKDYILNYIFENLSEFEKIEYSSRTVEIEKKIEKNINFMICLSMLNIIQNFNYFDDISNLLIKLPKIKFNQIIINLVKKGRR